MTEQYIKVASFEISHLSATFLPFQVSNVQFQLMLYDVESSTWQCLDNAFSHTSFNDFRDHDALQTTNMNDLCNKSIVVN